MVVFVTEIIVSLGLVSLEVRLAISSKLVLNMSFISTFCPGLLLVQTRSLTNQMCEFVFT